MKFAVDEEIDVKGKAYENTGKNTHKKREFDYVIILRFCSYAIPSDSYKLIFFSDLKQYSSSKCVQTTNSCFFTHNKISKISQDFNY